MEVNPPSQWKALREVIGKADGVLFLTPEYNRSVPAVLKNAIDIGSRPKTDNRWNGKPGGVVSISPGNLSGFGANHHLRQTLVPLNVPVMAQPEAYIAGVAGLFDSSGELTNESTAEFLKNFMNSYAAWVRRNS